MKKTKIVTLLLILAFCVSSLSLNINPVKADEFLLAYHNTASGTGGHIGANHPSPSGGYVSARGSSFYAVSTAGLTIISVPMVKVSNPLGTITAVFCSISGTPGAGATYNADIEESSTSYNVSALSDSVTTWVNFTFSGTNELVSGGAYGFYIKATAGTWGTKHVLIYGDSAFAGNTIRYIDGAWGTDGQEIGFYIYGEPIEDTPDPTVLTYTYTVVDSELNDVWPTFEDWCFQVDLNQSRTYHYNGQLWNNSMPWLNGTFYIWKTPLDNISRDNAIWDMNFDNWTLNYSAPLVNGWVPWINFSMPIVPGGGTYYQGVRINFTVTDTTQTYTSDLLLIFHETNNYFLLTFNGDIFVNAQLAQSPTQITLKQSYSSYAFTGYSFMNDVVNGTGNFTLYSTGISSSPGIMTFGTFTQTAFGTIGNGSFTFGLAPRSASFVAYEGLRITTLLDTGLTETFTYFIGWYRPGDTGTFPAPPYPAVTTQPISSAGVIDSVGYSNFLDSFVSFMLLFILVGAPALLLGTKAGMPGLIIGATLGLGLGVMAGLLAWWFIFLIASGVAVGFMMWRKNNGQG